MNCPHCGKPLAVRFAAGLRGPAGGIAPAQGWEVRCSAGHVLVDRADSKAEARAWLAEDWGIELADVRGEEGCHEAL